MTEKTKHLSKEEAIELAIVSLRTPSMRKIADQAGISVQKLSYWVNRRLKKEESLSPDRLEAPSSTPASTGVSDLSETTIPGANGSESL